MANWGLNPSQTAPYPPRGGANTTGCAGGLRPQLPCLVREARGQDGGGALLDSEGLA